MNEKIPYFNSQFNIDKPDYFYQILLSGLDKFKNFTIKEAYL